ncbi:carboxylating nicotinate-nucleotide diphosphorylase [Rubellicoccus peritrichatus]|uniref:nicotinate-nucleotide diphosphorylase (carboxylating) n=1 Tax=Rubellicoccus peritrichatus TaxID=3080537 RepID=A0AAQ3L8D7_9BACT|nr:carboxylating nicotinate-nucleotide diphosphorylase [Puniceicoccus sp. CR14]WOO41210.1 carboxylating nicotinate-nucleotide diphosphorylase [Puniceicoccus sp. CR14]
MNTPHKPERFRDHLFRRLTWEELDTGYLRHLVELARTEDLEGSGLKATPAAPRDVTTETISESATGKAELTTRTAIHLAGLNLVPLIIEVYGDGCEWHPKAKDGDSIQAGAVIGELSGKAKVILQCERILLNFLQHLSGIATHTARHVDALGWSQTRLLDTRKTTPGFRMLEKYAVACGGGWNHRLGLFDRVMLKDNHLAASHATAGERLAEAVRLARRQNPSLAIEVEVDSLEQIPPVLEAEADIILLDNFSTPELVEAVSLIGERAYTEASGGVTLESLPELGGLGLDFISCGGLIHQSTWIDIGLDWKK